MLIVGQIYDFFMTEQRLKFYQDKVVKYTKYIPDYEVRARNAVEKVILKKVYHMEKERDQKLKGNFKTVKPKKKEETFKFNISKNSRRKFKKHLGTFRLMSNYPKPLLNKYGHNTRAKGIFVTLTLPTLQDDSTAKLNSTIFKSFLNVIRTVYNIRSYVWRLEFQKNGNAHWHLLIDQYVHWGDIRKVWNNILIRHGYMEKYTAKMEKMNYDDYRFKRDPMGKYNYEKFRKAYKFGVESSWQNPNTVDVEAIKSQVALARYMSKYMSKNKELNTQQQTILREREDKQFRHFGASYNIIRAIYPDYHRDDPSIEDSFYFIKSQTIKTYTQNYSTIYYINIKDKNLRKSYERFIQNTIVEKGFYRDIP